MLGKTVVAISSTVMRGAVGLRPITFALERRGLTVWPVPTVMLPWHPGIGPSTKTPNPDLPGHLADLGTRANEIDAILTGYYALPEHVEATAAFIDTVRRTRPGIPVLIDPVTGDEAGRYVPDAVATAVREELVPRADIITPNVNELVDLGGSPDLVKAAEALGARQVIVTSAVQEDGQIGTLLLENGNATLVMHDEMDPCPKGTGDLFSAVYLASSMENAPADAVRDAAAATFAAVRASTNDLLAYAAVVDDIANPDRSSVTVKAAADTALRRAG
ncbi:bifunctional hydroxymethylpyrimidine kinase/phosphomethylpyrimidine kinase [Acuticoccus sediminis]|uniref:bifunctional hydroxymethylpyrimidine kinase/phosphomethylpyrimidine kinase n=1 Tax=Acuticoccus sediminis TaxID=2184697 RepID=UPI001CFD444D|nr:bifunctional hydroxymethylpyrimidine kinase/phosphomethylpyrimidine kinase [Acuticoccus sediminis]